MLGYQKVMTLVSGSHDESLMVFLSLDRLENLIKQRLHVSTYISLNKLYTTFQVIQLIRPWQSVLNTLIGTEWSSTYRDSLAHQDRDGLAYGVNISRYLYCGIHKCFHPRMDWEQYGGEIQSKTSSTRCLRKAQALIFNANYSLK